MMRTILHFNLDREFFAQIAAGTKLIENSSLVMPLGLPNNYPDAKKLVTEDRIRPSQP